MSYVASVSASSNYASGSSRLLEQPEPSQENKNKFINSQSYLPIDGSEALKVVKVIAGALPAHVAALKQIDEGIKWRQFDSKQITASASIVKGVKNKLTKMCGDLFKEAGVQKTFPGITEISRITEVLLPSKEVEVDLIHALKMAEQLTKRIENPSFIKIYSYRALIIKELVSLVLSKASQKHQVLLQRIPEICADLEAIEVPRQKSNKRIFRQIHLEILDACLLAANKLAPSANFALAPCIRNLEQLKANVLGAKNAIKVHEPAKNFEAPVDQLRLLQVGNDESYAFSRFAHADVWWPSWRGYAKTNNLGEVLEKIGQKIYELETIVKMRLKEVLQGIVPSRINDDVAFYTDCYWELKARLSTIFKTLNENAFDELTITALNYVSGIQTGLDTARSTLITLRANTKEPQRQVLEALGEFDAFYRQGHGVMQLYDVASKMQRCLQYRDTITNDAIKPHACYVKRTFHLLQELHAVIDDKLLQQIGGMENLFDNNVEQDHLLDQLACRMQRFLFFPSKKHDIELELMLYAIRTLPRFASLHDTMQRMPSFNAILKSYDDECVQYRQERLPLYPIALEIITHALEGGVLGNANSMLLLRENFQTLPDDIKEMLIAKLQVQATKHRLPIVYPEIVKSRSYLWNFSDTIATDRLISQLSESIRLVSVEHSDHLYVWQALFFGLLSQALYGKTAQDRVKVQKNIRAMLQEIPYKRFLVIPNKALEYLICENAMRCVELSGAYEKPYQLTALEQALLEDGPFQNYYDGTLAVQEHARVGNVLRKCLMTPNSDSLLATFKQKTGVSYN